MKKIILAFLGLFAIADARAIDVYNASGVKMTEEQFCTGAGKWGYAAPAGAAVDCANDANKDHLRCVCSNRVIKSDQPDQTGTGFGECVGNIVTDIKMVDCSSYAVAEDCPGQPGYAKGTIGACNGKCVPDWNKITAAERTAIISADKTKTRNQRTLILNRNGECYQLSDQEVGYSAGGGAQTDQKGEGVNLTGVACNVKPRSDAVLPNRANNTYNVNINGLTLCASGDNWDDALRAGKISATEYNAAFAGVPGFQAINLNRTTLAGQGGGGAQPSPVIPSGDTATIIAKYKAIVGDGDKSKGIQGGFDLSDWTSKTGGFNWFRVAIDAAGGAIVGTGAGLLTNTLIKNSQLKTGRESVYCTYGSGNTAAFAETFVVR